MSYDELLAQVYAALPQLKGQLHAPRVVYVQSQGKVYITFESNVLVEEASFLKLEALLRRVFPQKPLAAARRVAGTEGRFSGEHQRV